jgi:hypothetical protein
MPIFGRTPRDCFDQFTEHASALVAATVTKRHPLLRAIPAERRMMLSFRSQWPVAIPIDTAHGRLYFYLGQLLEATDDLEHGFRLITRQYWYRLQHSEDRRSKATIRWEYDRSTAPDGHARHHTQMAAKLALGDKTLDLNKAHLATGWTTMEEVIRFLIVDLDMRPPCGDEWPAVLEASERKFFEDFTGKRYEPGTDG